MNVDVAIIGGGIAGTAAALAAAAAGARVALIRAGPGATALAAGGWTAAPPAAFGHALAAAGHVLVPVTAPLPHPVGDLRAAAAAHEAHAGAAIVAGACVVGMAGLPGFRPRALARLWGDAAGAAPAHEQVRLDGTPAAGWAAASLAAVLEHDAAPLGVQLAAIARRTGATRLILPAVLGVDRAGACCAALTAAAGVPVAEALGAPPSLPGWRLHRALDRVLASAGIAVVPGTAGAPDRTGDRLLAVTVTAAGTPARRIEAAGWVLATGRFVGGGVTADPRWRETALDVPLRLDHLGATFDAAEPLATTSPDRRAGQPPLDAGILVDAERRPLDPRTGQPPYANVHAAGSVCAGPLADANLGAAAADGWHAGSRAAALAGVAA